MEDKTSNQSMNQPVNQVQPQAVQSGQFQTGPMTVIDNSGNKSSVGKYILIMVIMMFLIVIGASGYFLFLSNKTQDQYTAVLPTVTPNQVVIPTAMPSPTPMNEYEEATSVDVGEIDTTLQVVNSDLDQL